MAGEAAGAPDAAHRGQAAEVDPDADGDVLGLGRRRHLAHLVLVAQVAGVEAQAVHAALQALEGELVVEVDVGDERDVYLLLDLAHGDGGVHVGNGGADDVAARLFQLVNLPHGGRHVAGVGLGHGLDGDFGVAAHLDAADVDRFGWPSLNHPFCPPLCRSGRPGLPLYREYLASQCKARGYGTRKRGWIPYMGSVRYAAEDDTAENTAFGDATALTDS